MSEGSPAAPTPPGAAPAPSPPLDAARAPRAGEELDTERLLPWLVARIPGLDPRAPLTVRQFPSGHSNLTYLLQVGGVELVLRRPPFGSKVKSAHDMGREYRVLSRLHAVYPTAPEVLAHTDDEGILGAPFYVMRRIVGVIVRRDFPAGVATTPEQVRAVQLALVDGLAELHAIDVERAGLADLGRPQGYVERQVSGWWRRYEGSQTDDVPALGRVHAWLVSELPPESGAALIHNDFKLDNVVLAPEDPTRIIGVLDWEMCTVGDPLMDLGTSLSYWVEATDPEPAQALKMGPTNVPGSLTRAEVAERYAARSGRDVSRVVYYHVFGLFKTAVVLQQIYYRFRQGLTSDPRFEALGYAVGMLADSAEASIARGRL